MLNLPTVDQHRDQSEILSRSTTLALHNVFKQTIDGISFMHLTFLSKTAYNAFKLVILSVICEPKPWPLHCSHCASWARDKKSQHFFSLVGWCQEYMTTSACNVTLIKCKLASSHVNILPEICWNCCRCSLSLAISSNANWKRQQTSYTPSSPWLLYISRSLCAPVVRGPEKTWVINLFSFLL